MICGSVVFQAFSRNLISRGVSCFQSPLEIDLEKHLKSIYEDGEVEVAGPLQSMLPTRLSLQKFSIVVSYQPRNS